MLTKKYPRLRIQLDRRESSSKAVFGKILKPPHSPWVVLIVDGPEDQGKIRYTTWDHGQAVGHVDRTLRTAGVKDASYRAAAIS